MVYLVPGTRYPSRLTLRDIISIWHRDIVTLFCVPFILRRYLFFFVRFSPLPPPPFPSRSPNRARGRFSASRNSISPTISGTRRSALRPDGGVRIAEKFAKTRIFRTRFGFTCLPRPAADGGFVRVSHGILGIIEK